MTKLTTPRLWFYMDCLFAEQEPVEAACARFGGAGPYALVVLLCEAYKRFFLKDEAGVIDMSYATLARRAGLLDERQAAEVLQHFAEAGIVQPVGCAFPGPFDDADEHATFRLRFLKWRSWTPAKLMDPTNAERQARARAKGADTQSGDLAHNQSRDPTLDPSLTVTLEEDVEEYSLATGGRSPKGAPRPEVARLSQLLADLIRQRDPKARVGPLSRGWLDAIRLLLDRDGRTEAEVEHVIRWCQRDDFWRQNILSATKLRMKFDQLYAKAGKPKGNADDFFSRNNL